MVRKNNKQWLLALGLSAIIAGCSEEKDYFQNPVDNLRPESEYFDFATRGDVAVSVDMGALAANTVYEIYLENPITVTESGLYTLRTDIEPAYARVMDAEGRSEGVARLPKAIEKVYLLNSNPLLPGCVELDVVNGAINYTYTEEVTTAAAKATKGTYIHTDGIEYGEGTVENAVCKDVNIPGVSNLKVLCEWANNRRVNEATKFTPSDYTKSTNRSQWEVTQFSNQVSRFFPANKDNSRYAATPNTVNIKTSDEKDFTNINIVFMGEDASWHSPFGYFYYKAGNEPTAEELANGSIPKYIILPDASDNVQDSYMPKQNIYGMFNIGNTVHLQFFGEDYNQPASYNFPPGYVIGWFVIGDAMSFETNGSWSRTCSWEFKTSDIDKDGGFMSSLDTRRNGKCVSFAAATNSSRNIMYIGVEDDKNTNTPDYNDLMFYVEANPIVISPDVPIMETTEDIIPAGTEVGTYAFEDQWPTSGDYDLNDVVAEYTHRLYQYIKVTTEDGNITEQISYLNSIESEFTFVQKSDAADFNNAFGIVIQGLNKSDVKEITLNGAPAQFENTTEASVLVTTNARAAIGQTFKLVITLNENNQVVIDNIKYDPFIVEDGDGSATGRYEVHLPKMTPTSMGYNGTNIHQYYVEGLTGAYPFAIDIPVKGWEQVKETIAIGNEGQYPTFRNWADSFGANNADWYLHKN